MRLLTTTTLLFPHSLKPIPVLKRSEFTDEFSREIADYAASFEKATYSDVVQLVGSSNINAWLITVAGDDSNYIG